MKYLELYESFENKDIKELCRKYEIANYTINKDGSIDVNSNVDLESRKLSNLPLKFNKVNGVFSCYNNQLKSLEGCPKIISNNFYCSGNQLTSLKGCPKKIPGTFSCVDNQLTSLEGCPEYIDGNFNFSKNKITSFEYIPNIGNFNCYDNPIFEIWKLFKDTTKIELFNDMDIIQDGVVILDRLNYFLEEIGKSTVKSIYRYKYI